jgi:hypothetical protein
MKETDTCAARLARLAPIISVQTQANAANTAKVGSREMGRLSAKSAFGTSGPV